MGGQNIQLNGVDIYDVFGVIVQDGLETLLAFPDRKASVEHNFNDVDGLDKDLQAPRFEARQFRLNCFISTNSAADFWTKYNGLFAELSAPGAMELYIGEYERSYTIYYIKQESMKKHAKINDELVVEFVLVFGETDWTDNIDQVYLVDHEGRYLIA